MLGVLLVLLVSVVLVILLMLLAIFAVNVFDEPGKAYEKLSAAMRSVWRDKVAGRLSVPDVPATIVGSFPVLMNSTVHWHLEWHMVTAPSKFLPKDMTEEEKDRRLSFWLLVLATTYFATVSLGTAILWGGSRLKARVAECALVLVILYYNMLCYAILYCTILYYTIIYYTIPHYTIPYYTILYHIITYYNIMCNTSLY